MLRLCAVLCWLLALAGCGGGGGAAAAPRTPTDSQWPVEVDSSGGGSVLSVPGGIDCGKTCSASFDAGTRVTLTARPDSGFAFVAWSGACAGSASTCVVTLSSGQSVGASFIDVAAPTLQITSPTGTGTYSTSASSLLLAGTASDNTAVTEVRWASSRGGSGVATLDGGGASMDWSAGEVPLVAGENTITVTARDAGGRNSSRTLVVTVGGSSRVVRLQWQGHDVPTLAGYRVYHGSTAAAAAGSVDVGLATDLDFTASAHGRYYFSVVAVDVSGVESARSEVVSVLLP